MARDYNLSSRLDNLIAVVDLGAKKCDLSVSRGRPFIKITIHKGDTV